MAGAPWYRAQRTRPAGSAPLSRGCGRLDRGARTPEGTNVDTKCGVIAGHPGLGRAASHGAFRASRLAADQLAGATLEAEVPAASSRPLVCAKPSSAGMRPTTRVRPSRASVYGTEGHRFESCRARYSLGRCEHLQGLRLEGRKRAFVARNPVSDYGRFSGALFGALLRCADASERSAASRALADRERATVVCDLLATGRRIPREGRRRADGTESMLVSGASTAASSSSFTRTGPSGRAKSPAPAPAARATEIQDTHYPPRLAEAIERKLARGASLPGDWAGRGAVPNCCRDGGDIEASAQARRDDRAGQAPRLGGR